MSTDLLKIRNPSIYHGGSVIPQNRTPFEMVDGVYCQYRNANTTGFQTYSPYRSTVTNISDLINVDSIRCKDGGFQETRSIYRCHEDVYGNTYVLFKNDSPSSIHEKRASLGVLYIIDPSGVVFDGMFGNFEIPAGESVKDVQVFYDKVLIITESRIWLGDAGKRRFFNITYSSHYQTVFHEDVIYILHDMILGEFEVVKFEDGDIVTITEVPLSDVITSSSMAVKKNRIELLFTDTSVESSLSMCEYDTLRKNWFGHNIMTMPYEIIAAHDDCHSWYIYYESGSFPNRVGGIRIEFEAAKPVSIEADTCTTEELNFIDAPTKDYTFSNVFVNNGDELSGVHRFTNLYVDVDPTIFEISTITIRKGTVLDDYGTIGGVMFKNNRPCPDGKVTITDIDTEVLWSMDGQDAIVEWRVINEPTCGGGVKMGTALYKVQYKYR